MGRVNGIKEFDEQEVMLKIKAIGNEMQDEKMVDEGSILLFFTNPSVRKYFFIMNLLWIAISCGYYGLTIHSMSLYGNEFVNFFLVAIIELPTYFLAWWMLESRLGRRWTNVLRLQASA